MFRCFWFVFLVALCYVFLVIADVSCLHSVYSSWLVFSLTYVLWCTCNRFVEHWSFSVWNVCLAVWRYLKWWKMFRNSLIFRIKLGRVFFLLFFLLFSSFFISGTYESSNRILINTKIFKQKYINKSNFWNVPSY